MIMATRRRCSCGGMIIDSGRWVANYAEAGSRYMNYRQCAVCWKYHAIAPSNDDDPRVAIEVRAAEMYACLADSVDRIRSGRKDVCVCFDKPAALNGVDQFEAQLLVDCINDRTHGADDGR